VGVCLSLRAFNPSIRTLREDPPQGEKCLVTGPSAIMSHFTPCSDSMVIHLNMLLGSEHAVAKQDMVPS
jgi:hypothetical protein